MANFTLGASTTTRNTYATYSLRTPSEIWYPRISVALHQRGLVESLPEGEYPYIVWYSHPQLLTSGYWPQTTRTTFDPTAGEPGAQKTQFFSNVLTESKIAALTKEEGPDKGFFVDFGVI